MNETSVRRLLDGVLDVLDARAGHGGSPVPEPAAVLARIAAAATRLTRASHGAFVLVPSTAADQGGEGYTDVVTVGLGANPAEPVWSRERTTAGKGPSEAKPERLLVSGSATNGAGHPLPGGFPATTSVLRMPVYVEDTLFGQLLLADKLSGGDHDGADERGFTEHDEDAVAGLVTAMAPLIGMASAYGKVELRLRWLTAAQEITGVLLRGDDPAAALRLIAERARIVSGSAVGAIARPDERADQLVFDVVATEGPVPADASGLSVSVRGTATGQAFTTGEPVLVRDYGTLAATYQSGWSGATMPDLVTALDSAIAVPLTVGDLPVGVLLVARGHGTVPFDADDVQLVRMFASQAALALEFGRAEQDRHKLAVFENRERIAHDLHDLVIQRLFAVGLGLEGLGKLTTDAKAGALVSGFVHDLDRTIKDIRNSIFSLQHPVEAPGGVRADLLRLCLGLRGTLGFEPRLSFDGPLDTAIPAAMRADLLAVVDKALTHAARRAEATAATVEVVVDRAGRTLTTTVADNGAAHPGERAGQDGEIAELEVLAADWDGTFSIGGVPGAGTGLTWTVRLPRHDARTQGGHA
ncbi:Histidine kinase [Prauserella marina]|uniref:Histidine kinase n=1 Tax=Prauserella marina TaxID=530584 RepID=A0A1G6VWR0_9PSEU|nr:histidine kinase [Prauserella marina]SDD57998.1 Histidine kinase [Prauserella marina]